MKTNLRAVALGSFVVVALLPLACGSDKKSDVTIEVRAQNTKFLPGTIEVPSGKTVTLRLVNLDSTEHDLEVRGFTPSSGGGGHGGGHASETKNLSVHSQASKTSSIDFRTDQKGTYDVVCTIPGHEASGMVGKLVIN